MEHALSTATASYNGLWSWVLARGRGHTVVLISVWCVYVGNNSCGRNNGGCSHLCLYRPTGHVCVCPPHVTCSESWSLSVCLSVCHTWYMYYQSVSIVVLSRSMRVRHETSFIHSWQVCIVCAVFQMRVSLTANAYHCESLCLSVCLSLWPSVRPSVCPSFLLNNWLLLTLTKFDGGQLRLHEADETAVNWLTTFGS